MKRIAVWAFYGIGALAILYLALYAYAAFTGRGLVPGDPIHIFRKPGGADLALAAALAARSRSYVNPEPTIAGSPLIPIFASVPARRECEYQTVAGVR
jgi:hypothetical protein